MSDASLTLFILASIALALVPGPDLLYITARSLSQGAKAGFISALGIHTGIIVHIILAALGISALIASSPIAFDAIKYTGAAYLIYLGVIALRSEHSLIDTDHSKHNSLFQIYYQGVITNVLNPKVILFFLAFFPQFLDPNSSSASSDVLWLGFIFVVVSFPFDAGVGLLAGFIGHCLQKKRQNHHWGKWVTGSVFILLGLSAAFSSPSSL